MGLILSAPAEISAGYFLLGRLSPVWLDVAVLEDLDVDELDVDVDEDLDVDELDVPGVLFGGWSFGLAKCVSWWGWWDGEPLSRSLSLISSGSGARAD